MNLSNIGVIKDLLSRHGFNFSKSLGQNFLINPSVCPKMAEASNITKNTGVIEIGPGIGVLTVELAERAKKVVTVEFDEKLKPILAETLADYDNVEIVWGDFLLLNLNELIEEKFSDVDEVVICANLPYYITTPILMKILEEKANVSKITAMVQKEAGERLCAELGTREVGAITVAVRYYSEPKVLFGVSRGSFMPAPNVDSSVISLDVKKEPSISITDEKLFFRVIKAAFSMRRKTLINCLQNNFDMGKEYYNNLFLELELNPKARAENLLMEDFANITNALSKEGF